jgi:uncharacterized membrane protein
MIVHFPIALIIVGFIAEVISYITKKEFFSQAAFYLFVLGSVGVLAAYFSGLNAGSGIAEVGTLGTAVEKHEDAALLATIVVAISFIFRVVVVYLKKHQGIFKYASTFLFLLAVLAIARTGYYGGELVYKHAAGVELDLGLGTPDTETPVAPETKDKD